MAEDNHKVFNEPIDPTKPYAVYTKKQKQCKALAADAGNLINMADMIKTGVMQAIITGLMNDVYHDWKRIPQHDCTWNK